MIDEKAKCGMSANGASSTRLGSIMTKRTSSGDACIRMQAMIELMQTLLPLPVAPAIKRWGILARSVTLGSPETLFPSASVKRDRMAARLNGADSTTLRSVTSAAVRLGTSIPTNGLPGTGDSMRSDGAASASAKSFESAVIWLTRTRVRETSSSLVFGLPSRSSTSLPVASRSWIRFVFTSQPGSIPNCVTVGPSFTCTTFALTPNEASASMSMRARSVLSG